MVATNIDELCLLELQQDPLVTQGDDSLFSRVRRYLAFHKNDFVLVKIEQFTPHYQQETWVGILYGRGLDQEELTSPGNTKVPQMFPVVMAIANQPIFYQLQNVSGSYSEIKLISEIPPINPSLFSHLERKSKPYFSGEYSQFQKNGIQMPTSDLKKLYILAGRDKVLPFLSNGNGNPQINSAKTVQEVFDCVRR